MEILEFFSQISEKLDISEKRENFRQFEKIQNFQKFLKSRIIFGILDFSKLLQNVSQCRQISTPGKFRKIEKPK